MTTREYAGINLEVTSEGYLEDSAAWSDSVANAIAAEEGIFLTREHFTVLEYLRKCHSEGEKISIRKVNKSGVVNLKTFYSLFPGAALRKASRIAGIPKPENCI
jgi:dissimilatory sulfite reductase related protein